MQQSLHTRAFRLAADVMGGTAALRDHLHVPSRDLARWMAGYEKPPVAVFLQVVDVIDEYTDATNRNPAAAGFV